MSTIAYSRPIDRSVRIEIDAVSVEADWTVPINPRGVVIFALGSGSRRFSRRNRNVARELYDQRLATLLIDLLTPDEEREDALTGALRFDVNLLAERLIGATRWVKDEPDAAGLPIGYFGTSVGAAAALLAAACRSDLVDAIVSCGGRSDLAGTCLNKVKAPTLLIVGGADTQLLALNRWAYWRMDCERHLEIIRGATHYFQERGALETTTTLATEWFDMHLASSHSHF